MSRVIRVLAIAAILTAAAYGIYTTRGDEKDENLYSGVVEATEVTVSAEVAGRITEIAVDEGARIEKGEFIARIDDAIFAAQLAQAEAARGAARAQYQAVGAGLSEINDEIERGENLYNAGSMSAQKMDMLRGKKDRLAAQRDAASHQIKQADATARLAQEQIGRATIVAPISGTVVARSIEAGESAMPGAAIVTIADIENAWVRIFVPETRLGHLTLGQTVKVTADSWTDRAFDGTIVMISDRAEFTPKNVQTREERTRLVYAVKIAVPNPDGALKIGMPVDARLP
ncbi:efflux RND transporter periplasmic adaptor subunit [bacterium]|nr:efflux RND transporter periplasmic adaptor subunit [bacterium]